MTYGTHALHEARRYRDTRSVSALSGWFAPGTCIVAAAFLVGAFIMLDRPAAPLSPSSEIAPPSTAARIPRPAPRHATNLNNSYVALLDPGFSLGAAPTHFVNAAPPDPTFAHAEPARPASEPVMADAAPSDDTLQAAEAEPDLALPTVPETGLDIPLPLPRPPALRLPPVAAPSRGAGRRLALARAAAVAVPDQRSFFEKLFGAPQTPGPALAYAAPEDGLFKSAPGRAIPISQATAIYDISAHTVYLPSGARLEAHSGLREKIDDPRFVSERMRGPTPPAIYALTPREALFHHVRALRLTPIGGGTTYGRTGLLAHTYMLGPNGQSNGCVSFRNYNAFLQAYDRGEVRRLLVVAHL